MLKSAMDVLGSGDVRAIVDFAIEANRTASIATKELSAVKTHLRGLAEERRSEDPSITNVKFEGHLGVAQVVMSSRSTLRARKGMKLQDLKKVLPEEVYAGLFEERVVVDVAPGYEESFASLSPSQRLVVEKYVETVPQTSRVNLPE